MSFFQQIFQDSQPPSSGRESVIPESQVGQQFESVSESSGETPSTQIPTTEGPLSSAAPTPTETHYQPEIAPPESAEDASRPAQAASPSETVAHDVLEPVEIELLPIEVHPSPGEPDSSQFRETSETVSQDPTTEAKPVSGYEQFESAPFEETPIRTANEETFATGTDKDAHAAKGRRQVHDPKDLRVDSAKKDVRSPDAAVIDDPVQTHSIHTDPTDAPADNIELAQIVAARTESSQLTESLNAEKPAPRPASSPDQIKPTASAPETVMVPSPDAPVRSADPRPSRSAQTLAAPKVQIRQIDIVIQSAAPAKPQAQSSGVNTSKVPWYLRTI